MARRRKPRRKKNAPHQITSLDLADYISHGLKHRRGGCQLIAQRSADVDTVAQHSDDTAQKQASSITWRRMPKNSSKSMA
ncbi:hypothetical protein [Lacticaseibacillus manihotivorans]|uniref:hypothetical protein n=1 Tax=Lacticaseibacillus manihotivorans TaxID=88233 RepID=UPI0006D042F7|nr:hypothetical protein [Lacticaseibacillus manihotivorans]